MFKIKHPKEKIENKRRANTDLHKKIEVGSDAMEELIPCLIIFVVIMKTVKKIRRQFGDL